MYTGLNHGLDELSVKQFSLQRYFFALVKPLTRISYFDYRCILNRLCLLLSFPIFRLYRAEVSQTSLSKTEADDQVRNLSAVLIALLMLSALFVLYIFRVYDDNRLLSWQWVFANNEIIKTSLILLPGLWLAWWLAGLQLPYNKALIFLLSSSFMLCSSLWGQPELIVDASRYFLQAKSLAVNGPVYFIQEWGYGIGVWTDLPLIPFIYGLVYSLAGEYRMATQVLTSLFFCGTMFLMYLTGKELWDETTGLCAAALLLGMPYLFTQIPLMLVDIPTMFFFSLAVYSMLMVVKTEAKSWLVMATVTIVLAMLCKYSTWLMLSVLLVLSICYRPRGKPGGRPGDRPGDRTESRVNLYKIMLTILTGVVLFFTVLLVWKYDAIVQQFNLLTAYQLPGLGRWQESHLSTFFYQVHPFITLAALCSVYVAWRKRDVRYLIISWMVLLVLLLEIKRIRYVLIVFPMLSLMAAYALRQIGDSRIRRYIVLSIIVSSLAVTFYGYSPFVHKTSAINIKHAGELLNNMQSSTVEVILLPQTHSSINPFVSVPLLDLFTTKQLVYWKHPFLTSPSAQKNSATSSLRFSWEYKLEDFYETSREILDKAIVIISESKTQLLPAIITTRLQGFHLKQRFAQTQGVYRYSTIVEVYEKNSQQHSVDLYRGDIDER